MNPTPAAAFAANLASAARPRSKSLPHSTPIALPREQQPADQSTAAAWVRARQKSPHAHPAPLRVLYGGSQLTVPSTGGAFPLPSVDNETRFLAYQFTHHGELIQIPVVANGNPSTAVITLPHFERGSIAMATWTADRTSRIIVNPDSKTVIARAINELLARRRPFDLGGTLRIDAISSPIPLCKGQGSSTGDAVAAVTAAAPALGLLVSDATTQEIVHAAEGASDPLCFVRQGATVIYRTRAGFIHQTIARALPRMMFVGFRFERGVRLSTGSQAEETRYNDADIAAAAPVYAQAVKGIRKANATMLLMAANRSLRLNQKIRRSPMLGELDVIAAGNGGFTTGSHSGDALAIGFDPMNSEGLPIRFATTVRELIELGAMDVHFFTTPGQF